MTADKPPDLPATAREKLAEGRLAEARDLLAEGLARAPNDPACIKLLAELALRLRDAGRTAEAEPVFHQILAADPANIEANLALAWIAQASGASEAMHAHFAAAIAALQTSLAQAPPDGTPNLKSRLQLATALRGTGRLAEATDIFTAILADHPTQAAAHLGLGWIAHAQQTPASVIRHFQKALQLGAKDHHAELALAAAHAALQNFDEAEAVYRDLAVRVPHWPAVHLALGSLARRRRDWPAASQHLRAGLALDPENLPLSLQLGEALCDMEAWEEADAIYLSILARAPAHTDAWIRRAGIAKARGDLDRAVHILQQAIDAAPLDLRAKKALRAVEVARNAYDWRREIADALAVAKTHGADIDAKFAAATILVEFGLTRIAAPLLSEILARATPGQPLRMAAGQLAMAARQIERMGLDTTLPPQTDEADPASTQLDAMRGVTEKLVPGAHTLLIVFGGTNNRLWLTFSLLHRLLQPSGASIVYARDLRQDWYASGVEGLGEDFAASAEALRGIAARTGARRILTLGNCVGCRGAMQFGLALNAQGVLGLAPKIRPGNDMTLDEKGKLRAARTHMPSAMVNIRKAYTSAASPPPVTLIYGEFCQTDAADALLMSEIPGITLTPIPGSHDTDSVKDLLVRGLLAPVLQSFVQTGTIPNPLQMRIASSAALETA